MSRDPQRIDRVLALLAVYWKQHPYLRLGQIVGNCAGEADAYYLEDDLLERWLSTEAAVVQERRER